MHTPVVGGLEEMECRRGGGKNPEVASLSNRCVLFVIKRPQICFGNGLNKFSRCDLSDIVREETCIKPFLALKYFYGKYCYIPAQLYTWCVIFEGCGGWGKSKININNKFSLSINH